MTGEVWRIIRMAGTLMARPLIGFTDISSAGGSEAHCGPILGHPAVGRLVAICQSFAFSGH